MEIKTEATDRVKAALVEAGFDGRLRQLDDTARSADDAASSLNVEVAQIVKTLIFTVEITLGDEAGRVLTVAALISGDKQCDTNAIPQVLEIEGKVKRPDAGQVKEMTGYSIGGVSPIALPIEVIVLIDLALSRHDELWAAAGHPHVVFRANFAELQHLTGGRVTGDL